LSLTGSPPGASLFPYTTRFRSNGGQKWMPWDQVKALTGGLEGVEMVPEVGRCRSTELPTGHENTLDWLTRKAPRTRCGLTEQGRSEEHTSELQSRENLVCRLLL